MITSLMVSVGGNRGVPAPVETGAEKAELQKKRGWGAMPGTDGAGRFDRLLL